MAERIDLTEAPLPAGRQPTKKPSGRGTGVPKLDAFAGRVFQLTLFVCLMLTGYLLWGLWSGAWSHETFAHQTKVYRLQQLENISFIFRLLQISGVFLTVTLLLFAARAESIGYWLLGTAVLLYAGLPFMTTQINWMRHQTPSQAGGVALSNFQLLAWLFAVPGCIWTVIDLGRRFGEAAQTAAAQRATAKYGAGAVKQSSAQSRQRQVFLGRCWEGPFCRDNIRVKCPIYLKRRGPCWWYKEGCMCEERIVLQAMITSDWKMQSAEAVKALETKTRTVLSPEAKRERCRNCVIYNEHQRQKHKALSVLTLVVVPAVLVWQFAWLQLVVNRFLMGLDAATKRFSFSNNPVGITVLHNGAYSLIAWVFILALGVVLLSQALKLIEYLCFKLKI